MPKYSPRHIERRLRQAIGAWEATAPAKEFAGVNLAGFKEAIAPSLELRGRIAALEDQLEAALAAREAADKASLALLARVVNGVRADRTEGEDGELYAAMGYTRKSARRTGLTRRGSLTPAPSATAASTVESPQALAV